MIEIENAKTGHRVLRKNGKLLASAFDPKREATAWADKMVAAATDDDMMIILGMGSGYHVAEVVSRRPRASVIVIDNDADLAARALEIHPHLSQDLVVVETNWIQLVEHPKVRDAVCGVYRAALHGPSFQIDPDYFGAVDRLLRGRDKLSFLLLLKTRPELLPLLDGEALGQIGDEPVSIKTMRRVFSPQAALSRERRLWRLLEELIV